MKKYNWTVSQIEDEDFWLLYDLEFGDWKEEATQEPVAKDNPLANEFISEDEINALQGEFKRTGIHEPVILKEYNLELLSEMRMGDFYDCIRKFEKYPTKKSNTGIK